MSEASTQPESESRPPIRWRRLAVIWGIVIAVIALLLVGNAALDTYAWRVTRWTLGDREFYSFEKYKAEQAGKPDLPFFATSNPPLGGKIYKRTDSLWEVLKAFGEGWIAIIVAGTLWVYYRYRWAVPAAAFIAISVAGGLSVLIRLAAGRNRPIHIDGVNDWELWRGFFNGGKDVSFPSGHATVAFAAAAVLSYLSPKGKVAFICTATGTAISRVAMGAHFWSDVIFGAAFGWTVALLLIAWMERPFLKLEAAAGSKLHRAP
jgi:membrane-associated phospholipid phosphatase